ncbi:MAG TPA: hypothetical protein VFE63_13125 [Roseiarcus sp.]|nr:hypothetical protein [Roseiarcus sp.]
MIPSNSGKIPYPSEQGINLAVQGIKFPVRGMQGQLVPDPPPFRRFRAKGAGEKFGRIEEAKGGQISIDLLIEPLATARASNIGRSTVKRGPFSIAAAVGVRAARRTLDVPTNTTAPQRGTRKFFAPRL